MMLARDKDLATLVCNPVISEEHLGAQEGFSQSKSMRDTEFVCVFVCAYVHVCAHVCTCWSEDEAEITPSVSNAGWLLWSLCHYPCCREGGWAVSAAGLALCEVNPAGPLGPG